MPFPVESLLLLLQLFQCAATTQIQFISKFSGQTVTGLVNSSFNFSWSFSGDVRQISWGVWDTTKNTLMTELVRVTQSVTVEVQSSSAYYGRVDGSRRDSSSNSQVIFTLLSITEKDETVYGCVLYPRNLDSVSKYDTVNFTVKGPPDISEISPNTTVKKGDTVILKCTARGNPPANITWTKDKRVVNVPLRNISREAAGSYRCTAVNGVGSPATADVFITVQYKPTIKSVVPLLVTHSWIGERVSLQCEADGVPLPNITWKKPDESPINSVQAAKSTVELLMQSDTDFGNYTCEAANDVGADTRKVFVKQLRAPGSPNISVTTEATSLTVTWLPPIYDGGSTVTGYLMQVINSTHGIFIRNFTTPHSARKLEIPNLIKNTVYTVRVIARNKVSFGTAAEILAKTKFVDVPEAVNTTCNIKKGKVILTWRQPANNGAVITRYKVYQKGTNKEQWTEIETFNNATREYVVSEVEKGGEYDFVVTATNDYGDSPKMGGCKGVKLPEGSFKPTGNQTGSSCGNQKEILHAVYITIICLLLISNIILIFVVCRMRTRSEKLLGRKNCPRCGDLLAMNPIAVKVEGDTQPFDVERTFEAPTYASTAIADYMPLHPSTRSWEISRRKVNIVKVIGKGAFSHVAKATVNNMRGSKDNLTVAVKMLKANAPASDKKDLLSELELMKKLKPHPHVIKLLGCVTETEPVLVLIEYVPYGDLLGYLRKSRGLNDTYFKDPHMKPQTNLTAEQLMKFAWQVADGMGYLSSKKIIHRDLAARNVLVGEGEKCKVTDFGMARDVHQEDIYNKTTRGRLPVKWTAYESLMYGTYTTQSDVWSYGVLLYEILSVGGSPYPDINARKIAQKLQEGYRMPKPKHVEIKLYQIMLDCWRENPVDRPTFERLGNTMKEMERNHKTYVNLEQYDHSLYANVNDLKVV